MGATPVSFCFSSLVALARKGLLDDGLSFVRFPMQESANVHTASVAELVVTIHDCRELAFGERVRRICLAQSALVFDNFELKARDSWIRFRKRVHLSP